MEEPSPLEKYSERRRETILKNLLSRLNDWSNEIPEQILHGGGNFKVRINWWTGVTGNLHEALQLDLIKKS